MSPAGAPSVAWEAAPLPVSLGQPGPHPVGTDLPGQLQPEAPPLPCPVGGAGLV